MQDERRNRSDRNRGAGGGGGERRAAAAGGGGDAAAAAAATAASAMRGGEGVANRGGDVVQIDDAGVRSTSAFRSSQI